MNLLLDHPTRAQIRACLTAPDSPATLPPASSAAWTHILGRTDLAHVLDGLVRRAWAEREEPLPRLTEEMYREFQATGAREHFQKAYYERRRRLGRAGIALLASESRQRDDFAASFLAKLEAILREKSWALPAHIPDPSGVDPLCIDLASAETAYLLAESVVVFGELMPPGQRKRIRARLREQIFRNYLARADEFFWTSVSNNWNAVCHHGVIGAALAIEEDLDLVAAMLETARDRLAVFLDGFTPDGGCTEGLDYWSYGFGNFTALNEVLEIRTGGALTLFNGSERIRQIARFAPALSLAGGKIVNFADAKNIPASDWVLAYLGQRLHDDSCRRQALENFRCLYRNPDRPVNYDHFNAYFTHWQRVFRHSAAAPSRVNTANLTPDTFLPELGVWVVRGVDRAGVLWELAAKGGHNDEHHNHNDLGGFILNLDGVPLLTEIGAPEYVKDFFVPEKRYTFLAARSLGHSVPLVRGHEQGVGAEYRAGVIAAECGADVVAFTLDLAKAYPAEAKLKRCTRRIALNKKAGELRVADEFELGAAGPVESAFITDAPKVVIVSPELAVVEKAGRRLELRADAGAVWDRVERHDYRDHGWQPASVSRLVLRPAKPERTVALATTIKLG